MSTTRLSTSQAAARVGVAASTWRAYVARGQAPAPDGHEELSGWPWWRAATVETWLAARPGRGVRTRP